MFKYEQVLSLIAIELKKKMRELPKIIARDGKAI
jgi:hypothetical protein